MFSYTNIISDMLMMYLRGHNKLVEFGKQQIISNLWNLYTKHR